jgi:lipopolysaccharide assembly outer membrane protein LptD (OstA)
MKYLLGTILLFTTIIFAKAQNNNQDNNQIQFINANRFFTTEKLGPENKIFVGEVAFQHDSSILYCDSAIYNTQEKKIDAFGNVEIQRLWNYTDTIFLFGDTIHYDGNTKIAKVRNHVRLVQDTTVLTTNFLDFNLKDNVGKYFNGGRIISGKDTITSVFGYYYSNTKDVYFKKNVKVFSPKAKIFTDTLKHNLDTRISYILGPSKIYTDSTSIYAEFGRYDYNENRAYLSHRSKIKSGEHTIEADSLFYDRTKGFGQGFGNVKIIDTVQNLILFGNYGEYHADKQLSMMTDSALFMEIDNKDTLWLHSDTIMSYIDTLFDYNDTIPFRILFAYRHVKVFKNDLQLRTDSLVYNQLDSLLMLFGSPVLWSDKNQLNASYIELYMSKNNPKELFMYDSAYIAEKIDSNKFNIVKSKLVDALFRHRYVYKVKEKGDVSAIYYLLDDSDSSIIGLGYLQCDSMDIYLHKSKIKLLVPYSSPHGEIYPPKKIPADKENIPGFVWRQDERPKNKYDIFFWKDDKKTKNDNDNDKQKNNDNNDKATNKNNND